MTDAQPVAAHDQTESHRYVVHFPPHPARKDDPHYKDFDHFHRTTRPNHPLRRGTHWLPRVRAPQQIQRDPFRSGSRDDDRAADRNLAAYHPWRRQPAGCPSPTITPPGPFFASSNILFAIRL